MVNSLFRAIQIAGIAAVLAGCGSNPATQKATKEQTTSDQQIIDDPASGGPGSKQASADRGAPP